MRPKSLGVVEYSRGGCRGRLAASQSSLVDIWHLPRALLRLGVVPVFSAALGRVLLPWLIRERTLDSTTQVSTTTLLLFLPATTQQTYLGRAHEILGLGPLRDLGQRVEVVDAAIGSAMLLPGSAWRRKGRVHSVDRIRETSMQGSRFESVADGK